MDYKQCKANEYERKNRFDVKIKQKVLLLLPDWSIRDAVQKAKETKRRGISGEILGKVFKGNSNKYHKNGGDCRIMNKVQKRNNEKKYQFSDQMI